MVPSRRILQPVPRMRCSGPGKNKCLFPAWRLSESGLQWSSMDIPVHDLEALAGTLKPVFRDYPEIAVVYLFGSVARGTASSESDIDLGLVLETGPLPQPPDRLLGDLAARLEALCAPRPVDLVILSTRQPILPRGEARGRGPWAAAA